MTRIDDSSAIDNANATTIDDVVGFLTEHGFGGMAKAIEIFMYEAMELERNECSESPSVSVRSSDALKPATSRIRPCVLSLANCNYACLCEGPPILYGPCAWRK